MRHTRASAAAFTRADLLALLTVVFFASFIMTPLYGTTHNRGIFARCLSNMRQLTSAWSLYAADYNGNFVQNPHGASHLGGHFNTSVWATGWLDWSLNPDNTNVAFLRNARYAALAPYLLPGPSVHKCPGDVYLSRVQQARGWNERVRSVVMNASIGGINSDIGAFDSAFVKILKTSDLLYPSPAETMVYFEEHPDSINDTSAFSPFLSNWVDLPASFHEGGGTFSFTDGHVELHSWRASARNLPVKSIFQTPRVRPGDPDVLWMRYHSARKTANLQ